MFGNVRSSHKPICCVHCDFLKFFEPSYNSGMAFKRLKISETVERESGKLAIDLSPTPFANFGSKKISHDFVYIFFHQILYYFVYPLFLGLHEYKT